MKRNPKIKGETHLFFVFPGSHPFPIDQKHMLARVVITRGLVDEHQLTPAKKIPEIELPRSSFLAPFLLNSHFVINLERKYGKIRETYPAARYHSQCYQCTTGGMQSGSEVHRLRSDNFLLHKISKCQKYSISIINEIYNTEMNSCTIQMRSLPSTRNS